MKDLNNIEDWYRDELSNYHIEPDKNVWDSLSSELDINTPLTEENISEWYKKEAAKLEERPDYVVWEKLSTKLDTASVWSKLSATLTRYEQYVWWKNIAIRTTAILILLMGGYTVYHQLDQQNLIAEHYPNAKTANNQPVEKTEILQQNNNISETAKQVLPPISPNITKQQVKQSTPPLAYSIIIENINIDKGNNNLIASNSSNMTKINSLFTTHLSNYNNEPRDIQRNVEENGITENDISFGYEKKDFLVKKKKNKIVFNNKRFSAHFAFGVYAKRFYLGLNLGVKKQTLITILKNKPVLGGFSQEYLLNFGNTIGSTFGWILSDKLNIETNLNFISTGGYKRTFSGDETSFEEELNLTYSTLSFLAKKMSNKSTFDNKKYSTNIIGGIYAGYLVSATSTINKKTIENNNFNNIDLGIVLGIEQDRYITKSFVITPGIRYQQGLIDISNNSNLFQSARNFSLEFNLGIKYIFLKRNNTTLKPTI